MYGKGVGRTRLYQTEMLTDLASWFSLPVSSIPINALQLNESAWNEFQQIDPRGWPFQPKTCYLSNYMASNESLVLTHSHHHKRSKTAKGLFITRLSATTDCKSPGV